LLYQGDALSRYDGRSAEVTRVIDGDTLVVDLPDAGSTTTRIRLWGIDTPEMADPDTGRPAEPLAKRARQVAQQLASNKTVTLELESHRVRGDFGRVLAHVHLPDGTNLAERLLKRGLAEFDDRYRHRYFRRYRIVTQQAQTRNLGLWQKRDDR
jgi:endonuclease YncB( thermonuclease family)